MKKTISLFVMSSCLCLFSSPATRAQAGNPPAATASARTPQASKQKSPVVRVQYLNTAKPRPLPFSDAVRVGNMLYLSGQIGSDENLKVVPGGIKAETRQAMDNIRSVLERNGSSLDHVVKCTAMLADMSEWSAMNEVYVTYFQKDRLPARSAFGANGLALGARIEIECMAVVK